MCLHRQEQLPEMEVCRWSTFPTTVYSVSVIYCGFIESSHRHKLHQVNPSHSMSTYFPLKWSVSFTVNENGNIPHAYLLWTASFGGTANYWCKCNNNEINTDLMKVDMNWKKTETISNGFSSHGYELISDVLNGQVIWFMWNRFD